jgi:hypothetical protein
MNVSSLSIVLNRYSDGLQAGRSEFDSRQEKEIFPSSKESRPALGSTKPSIEWVPGTLSPEIKRPGRENGHSHPSSAEAKNGGDIPPLPIHLHGVVLN